MSHPPETDPTKRAVQRGLWQALEEIESARPLPPKPVPLDPEAWARELKAKAEALAFIETFKPWWVRDA